MGPLLKSPLRWHPPRLLPLLPVEGRGKIFKASSPLSQPQVGGVLSRHWRVWQSFGASEWTVTVLWDGYRVPFHHLPPVSLDPRELPSCSPGSVRALAIREGVFKMLLKGTAEPVDQHGPGFYSRLFLVEKVMGAGSLSLICRLSTASSRWRSSKWRPWRLC